MKEKFEEIFKGRGNNVASFLVQYMITTMPLPMLCLGDLNQTLHEWWQWL